MESLLGRLGVNSPMEIDSIESVIVSLFLSFILGLTISLVYRNLNKGFSYESSFNLTLVMISIIVTVVMITIGSNIALSLGLIGALSIIRFRTVLKNTVDMAYLFWSIAVGLAVGAQNYSMAVSVVIFMSIMLYFLDKTNLFMKVNNDYIVVVQMAHDQEMSGGESAVSGILDSHGLKWEIRSSFVDNSAKSSEITYSVHSKKFNESAGLLDSISGLASVKRVSLLSPDTNLFI